MDQMKLEYGNRNLEIDTLGLNLEVLGVGKDAMTPLTDVEIGHKLDQPIGSLPMEDLIGEGDRVLLVVPDGTRKSGAGAVANLLVRRLISSGIAPYNIAAIFATGIHRAVTEEEKREILTPFLAQRLKTFSHSATDLMKKAGLESSGFTYKGTTGSGIDVWMNHIIDDFDKVITIGSVGFHYFAGFSGGRKLICPGLASVETIEATHRLAFDFEKKTRRVGVASGHLDGNPVNDAFMECAALAPPTFSINTLVDEKGAIEDMTCGHWIDSHRNACERLAERSTVVIPDKREVVIVSCGGAPSDVNLIQAHKSLESASSACKEGGTIIFIAECRDGLGRPDFMKWFSHGSSEGIADALGENYEVNGQTAWSLRTKTERFDVRMVSSLNPDDVSKMGMSPHETIESALTGLSGRTGYIVPDGQRILIETK
jgi:nickel-dependent lactate racemase